MTDRTNKRPSSAADRDIAAALALAELFHGAETAGGIVSAEAIVELSSTHALERLQRVLKVRDALVPGGSRLSIGGASPAPDSAPGDQRLEIGEAIVAMLASSDPKALQRAFDRLVQAGQAHGATAVAAGLREREDYARTVAAHQARTAVSCALEIGRLQGRAQGTGRRPPRELLEALQDRFGPVVSQVLRVAELDEPCELLQEVCQ